MTNDPCRLFIYLPADRWKPGFLHAFDAAGNKRLYDLPCRGKADGQRAAQERNAGRDPVKPYGDTPSGLYRPSRITRLTPPHKVMGPIIINLEGQHGEALKARQTGRRGLAIHGGRGDDRLMATHGCLRLFDRDMALLADLIGEARVVVEIFTVRDWPNILGLDA